MLKELRGEVKRRNKVDFHGSGLIGCLLKSGRVKKKKVCWKCYVERLSEGMEVDSGGTVEDKIGKLQEKMLDAVRYRNDEGFTRKRRNQKWWTGEMEEMRKKVIEMRRNMQREGREELREREKERYKGYRRRYMNLIRRGKRDCWRNFVKEEGKVNMWGTGFKMMMGKCGSSEAVQSVRKEGGYTSSVLGTLEVLMDRAVVTEDMLEENGRQVGVRRKIEELEEGLCEGEDSAVEEEVWAAIRKFKLNKAPGDDGITVKMVMMGWNYIKREVVGIMEECRRKRMFPNRRKRGRVIWIRKVGKDRADQGAYRPICLLPVFRKILERIILHRMSSVLKRLEHRYQCLGVV